MQRKQYVRLLGALLAGFMIVAACGDDGTDPSETTAEPATTMAAVPSEEGPVRIAYLAGFTAHDWSRVSIDAANAAAEELGATLEVFDAGGDPATQYAQVQDLITADRFDGFVIMTLDGAGIVPAIEEAVDAGLAVVDYAFPVGTDLGTTESQVAGMTGSVVISAEENGATIADIIIAGCETLDEDPCEVALLPGSLTVSSDAARVRVIERILGETPGVELVATQETGYTEDGAFGVAQDLLLAHADLDMFAAIGSESVAGARRAVIDAGLEGEILLGGGACSTNSADAVRSGDVFACYRGTPIEDNRTAVEMIVKDVRGEPIEDRSPTPGEEAGWPAFVTAETIGDREGQWTD